MVLSYYIYELFYYFICTSFFILGYTYEIVDVWQVYVVGSSTERE